MAFDAYTIAIRLSMVNAVSPGLQILSKQFGMLDAQALAFQKRLNGVMTLFKVGAGLMGAGALGLYATSKMMKPALEYEHQVNIMRMAGMSQIQMNEAIADSWANTGKVITTTASGNLKTMLDLRTAFAAIGETDFQKTRDMLPVITKINAVLASATQGSFKGFDKDQTATLIQALSLVGANKNAEEFSKEAWMMEQVMVATQMRVTPAAYQTFFRRAQNAKFVMDDTFKYGVLPTLLMENTSAGGGTGARGIGLLAGQIRQLITWGVQGSVNRLSLPQLASMGLFDPTTALSTTTSGTTVAPIKGADLLQADPFKWFMDVFNPAMIAKFGNLSDKDYNAKLLELLRGQQGAVALFTEFHEKYDLLAKGEKLYGGALSGDQAYQMAVQNDPGLAFAALSAQWTNFVTALAVPITTIVIPTLQFFTDGLQDLTQVLIKYPTLAQILMYSFVGLSASLAFSGLVLILTGAFKGLFLTLSLLRFIPALAPALNLFAASLASFYAVLLAPALPFIAIAAVIATVVYGLWKLYEWLRTIKALHGFFDAVNKINPQNKGVYQLGKEGLQTIPRVTGLLDTSRGMNSNNDISFLSLIKKVTSSINPDNKGVWQLLKEKFNVSSSASPIATRNNNKPMNIHTTINMDKRKVAHAISSVQAQELTSIPNYISRTDYNMHPVSSMTNLKSLG